MDWDRLKTFYHVASVGSISKAIPVINLSQSAITRQIQSLENSLKTKLFKRHTKGLTLTEQGNILFEETEKIFIDLNSLERKIIEFKKTPSGSLSINTTVGFGSMWLSPRINQFVQDYPDINLKLNYSEDEQDMLRQDYDVGIWMSRPKHLDLISKHIATIKYHIYGSSQYINEMGMPLRRSELAKHRLITYGLKGKPSPLSDTNWLLRTGIKKGSPIRKPHVTINNLYGLLVAVETGTGLAALPDYMVQHKAHLVKILPEVEGPTYEVHMVYHENLKGSLKIIAFRDFLIKKIDEWRF